MTAKALGIVVDDLTGAIDCSGHLASQGLSTIVILDLNFRSTADVMVINTDSRADDINTACEKVKQAVRSLAGRIVYKKIDSTLRGNIGVELNAVMEELACEKAIVAPAFPAVGRTTMAGIMLVDGVSVSETQYACDPISPAKESHIPSLLERTTRHRVGCVTVECIDAGPESLYHEVSRMPQDIVVCDVTTQYQLTCIVQAAALANGRWMLCGSGGLARELPLLLTKTSRASRATSPSLPSGPALVVAGTRNQVTASQLLKARDERSLTILNLEVENLNQENVASRVVRCMVGETNHILSQGKSVALSSTFSQYAPSAKQVIAATIAEVVAGILAKRKLAGLYLSGGDTAAEVCRKLSVSAILVRGEIEPGVPAAELIGGQGQGIRVVTKAGGFGTEAVLIKSISYLEKGHLL